MRNCKYQLKLAELLFLSTVLRNNAQAVSQGDVAINGFILNDEKAINCYLHRLQSYL